MTNVAAHTPSDTVDDASTEFSFLDFLTMLARRKWFLVSGTLATGFVVGGLSFLIAPRYTSTVTLMPPQQTGSAGSASLAQLSGLTSLGVGTLGKSPVEMYVSLMRSVTVEHALIKRFDLAREYKTEYKSRARKTLESNVSIEANRKDGLIRLSVTDTSAPRAPELANGYIECLSVPFVNARYRRGGSAETGF